MRTPHPRLAFLRHPWPHVGVTTEAPEGRPAGLKERAMTLTTRIYVHDRVPNDDVLTFCQKAIEAHARAGQRPPASLSVDHVGKYPLRAAPEPHDEDCGRTHRVPRAKPSTNLTRGLGSGGGARVANPPKG
jgi:hypothetical protein